MDSVVYARALSDRELLISICTVLKAVNTKKNAQERSSTERWYSPVEAPILTDVLSLPSSQQRAKNSSLLAYYLFTTGS